MLPKIPKFAATGFAPLNQINYNNELFSPKGYEENLKYFQYLRGIYESIYMLWEKSRGRSVPDAQVYEETEKGIRELILGVSYILEKERDWRPLKSSLERVKEDFEGARMHAAAPDYPLALIFQSYALIKLHSILSTLSRGKKKFSSTSKVAYGYDTSGEIHEENGGQNIRDTANPQDHHETTHNPANSLVDVEADRDFPELAAKKHQPNIFQTPRE